METDPIQKRLFNKAHIFEPAEKLCSRCGVSMMDALNSPFRCGGAGAAWAPVDKPMTLTQAIDVVENPR